MCSTYAETIHTYGPVPDNKEKLNDVFAEALKADMVLISAGVSAGDHDFVPEVLQNLGVEKVFHKIDLKPGHPLWFGIRGKTLVFGLPGNPVSGQVCFKLLVESALKKMSGMTDYKLKTLTMELSEDFHKHHLRHEWAMANVIKDKDQSQTRPLKHTGSGDFFHYGSADALVSFPGEAKTFLKGSLVEVMLL
jgi:molybdopterin molybdotransferase